MPPHAFRRMSKMKRRTILRRLEVNLPSFSVPFIKWGREIDKATDTSWLYASDRNPGLPDRIPADFLEGRELDIKGKHYVSRAIERHRKEEGRMIKLEVIDFAFYGNRHKYGSLYIDGLEWYNADSGCTASGTAFHEADPLVDYYWKVELYKIIRKEDGFFEEPGYETGQRTQRFTTMGELYATAAYVSLFRVLGPFSLYEGSYCTVPRKKDLILSVDAEDNVTIGSAIRNRWINYLAK